MDFQQMLEILKSVLQSLRVNFYILKAVFLLFPTWVEQKSLPFNISLMH